MRYKLTFALGFGAGYVLGAKAGTQRYAQIENAWRRFVETPAVQEAAGVVGAQASQAFDHAKRTVGDKIGETVSSKMPGRRSDSQPGGSPDWHTQGAETVTAGDDATYPSGT